MLGACGEENRPTATSVATLAGLPESDMSSPAVMTATSTLVAPTATLAMVSPTNTPAPTPKAGPAVIGDLPAPLNARKLDLSLNNLQQAQKLLGGKYRAVDLSSLKVAAYASPEMPADVFDYYRAVMKSKGWTESQAYDRRVGIYFVKGSEVAAVGAIGVPDDLTVNFLAGFVPQVKGQVAAGESLVGLAQGPASIFQVVMR
jgi:hypothetical protein